MKKPRNVTGFPPEGAEGSTVNRKLGTRWGGHEELFISPEGWVGVPDAFLRNYARLRPYGGLTAGEALFVLQLMTHKWSADAPFPSYKRVARRMGISDKMARRYAANLEAKGYLKREARIGSSNSFNLQPLFDALKNALMQERQVA